MKNKTKIPFSQLGKGDKIFCIAKRDTIALKQLRDDEDFQTRTTIFAGEGVMCEYDTLLGHPGTLCIYPALYQKLESDYWFIQMEDFDFRVFVKVDKDK